ncbi:AAA family ATPase [Pedobacter miscanthi]|uniref:Adenylate kinase n=1 Tax=Pedobacter miscanthi TaxID=2259170 RepID=A0A366L7U5_9SPHI|nr:adenylate kinase [Pedobacter miscanthi]RBQ09961.1 adenylate kinase [Pedobacter miscanthi]
MKIHILGASCAGSTTLGKTLSTRLNIPYFDTDTYFWEKAVVPYTVKREPKLRNQLLKDELNRLENYIVGGSLVSWGEEWKQMFDLAVFLYLPKEIRMERLVQREIERYGNDIYDDPQRHKLFLEFIDWASKYDDRSFTGRNIGIHESWLEGVNCPVIKIEGDTTVAERLRCVIDVVEPI